MCMVHKVDIVIGNGDMRALEFGANKHSHKGFLSILDSKVNFGVVKLTMENKVSVDSMFDIWENVSH